MPHFFLISEYNAESNPMDKSIALNSYGGWNDSISLVYKEVGK